MKKGKNLDWCDYTVEDSEKFKIEHIRKVTKNNCKPVEIFKDNISQGIFPSAQELDEKSEELFGAKLNFCKISAVCRGKKPQYKGYTFKFVA